MGLAGLGAPPGEIENEDLDANYRAAQAARSVIHVMSDGSWSATLNVSEGPATWTGGIFNIAVTAWNAIPVTPTVPWLELATGAGLLAAVLWIVVGDASVTAGAIARLDPARGRQRSREHSHPRRGGDQPPALIR